MMTSETAADAYVGQRKSKQTSTTKQSSAKRSPIKSSDSVSAKSPSIPVERRKSRPKLSYEGDRRSPRMRTYSTSSSSETESSPPTLPYEVQVMPLAYQSLQNQSRAGLSTFDETDEIDKNALARVAVTTPIPSGKSLLEESSSRSRSSGLYYTVLKKTKHIRRWKVWQWLFSLFNVVVMIRPSTSLIWTQFMFLLTGLISTLGAQWLFYQKAADGKSFLTVLATYLGMGIVYFLPSVSTASLSSSLVYSALDLDTKKADDIDVEDEDFELELEAVSAFSKKSQPASPEPPVPHAFIFRIAFLDVIGNVVLTIGLFYVGSGLYQVLYSSVIIFTALLTRVFLKKTLTARQWLAILLITVGLALSATGNPGETSPVTVDGPSLSYNEHHEPFDPIHEIHRENIVPDHMLADHHEHLARRSVAGGGSSDSSSGNILLGFFITLFGTFLYAGVYTLNDYSMTKTSKTSPPPSTRTQCAWIGIYSTLLLSLLILFTALPAIATMDSLLHRDVIAMYILLIWSSYAHNITYFELIQQTGAVATGVLQALRAVLVFGLSHGFFCARDSSQCFTSGKGVAAFVVICGVLWFSWEKGRASEKS